MQTDADQLSPDLSQLAITKAPTTPDLMPSAPIPTENLAVAPTPAPESDNSQNLSPQEKENLELMEELKKYYPDAFNSIKAGDDELLFPILSADRNNYSRRFVFTKWGAFQIEPVDHALNADDERYDQQAIVDFLKENPYSSTSWEEDDGLTPYLGKGNKVVILPEKDGRSEGFAISRTDLSTNETEINKMRAHLKAAQEYGEMKKSKALTQDLGPEIPTSASLIEKLRP